MKVTGNIFEKMTSLSAIFECWDHFRQGKRKRKDIQYFERNLEDNIWELQNDLMTLQYTHASYAQFTVSDPKERNISKATVKDRLVHQIVYSVLTAIFDKKFIFHSLSSRIGKGTHIGVKLLHKMIQKVSKNGIRPCFALKMDIKRFFDSVHHQTLKILIRKTVKDEKALKIIEAIIDSFKIDNGPLGPIGIPLGNATSQLFANIYLHELDDFIKQELREPYYLRYCDDFIILSDNEAHLKSLISPIREFLTKNLHLELHPKKLIIRKLSRGIDFVGYVLFQKHILVRARTKHRMKKCLKKAHEEYLQGNISAAGMDQKLQSYLGIISHANQHSLSQAMKNAYWIRPFDA